MKGFFAVMSFAMAAYGCNLGGYPDLGSKLDTLTSIGEENATAWMRTADDAHSDILVLGGPAGSRTKGFFFVTMERDSTGSILAGTYRLLEDQIVLSVESEYRKTLDLEHAPASREGSTRTDYDPPHEIVYAAKLRDEQLHLSRIGGASMVMTNLWEVIPSIDVSTQAGVEMLSRVFNLSTVSLQMRIPGFGGAGLMQYAREPSEFVGAIGGVGSVEMTSVLNPVVVEMRYIGYQDFPGMILDGDLITKTNMGGDGKVDGTIHFSMVDPREGGEFSVEGDLLDQVSVKNGISSDGVYTITLSNGTTWTVPHESAENMDFRDILPPN